MGKPKSSDFRVISRRLLGAALGVALSAAGASAVETGAPGAAAGWDRVGGIGSLQLAQSSSSDRIKNIQRLLTLLADRYGEKYGSVKPGQVDGSFGAETKAAIRRYQEIAGITPGSRTNEQLEADILATLAQMSAEQPAESLTTAAATDSRTPDAAPTSPAKTSTPPAATAAPEPVAPAKPDSAPKPARAAPVPPAKAPIPASATATVAQAAAPTRAPTDRVYFSQLASLRTLESAQREWQRIFDANRAALNGEQVYFEEAEIAGRGTFHRILVGPIPERDAAKTLCGYLKQNDQPCVVISRFLSSLRRLKDKNGQLAPPTLAASLANARQPETATAAPVEQAPAVPEKSDPATAAPVAAPSDPDAPDQSADGAATTDIKSETPAAAEPSGADADTPPAAPSTESAEAGQETATAEAQPSAPEPASDTAPDQQSTPSIQEASKVFEPKAEDAKTEVETAAKAGSPKDIEPAAKDAAPSANPATTSPTADAKTPATPPAPSTVVVETATVTASSEPDRETVETTETTQTATLIPFGRTPGASGSNPPATGSSPEAGTEAGTGAGTSAPSSQETGAAPVSPQSTRQAPTLLGILADIRDYLGGTQNILGFAALVIFGGAILQFVWWRRSRQLAFSQVFRPGNLTFGAPVPVDSEPADALEALETDFDSEQLRESRTIRDEFLRDILGDDVDLDETTEKKEPAIRINSSLKSLLISDPAQYKSIFLNWIFLSKVGAALDQQEITMEDLNGHFGREFKLLQSYFKIHLLELDARHRIRKELPGLFHCLRLAQQHERQATGAA